MPWQSNPVQVAISHSSSMVPLRPNSLAFALKRTRLTNYSSAFAGHPGPCRLSLVLSMASLCPNSLAYALEPRNYSSAFAWQPSPSVLSTPIPNGRYFFRITTSQGNKLCATISSLVYTDSLTSTWKVCYLTFRPGPLLISNYQLP